MWICGGLVFKNKWNHVNRHLNFFSLEKLTISKMHISHIQGAVTFVSMMYKVFPVKSVCWGPKHSPKQGWVSPRCTISSKHGLLDGGQPGVESVINWSVGPVWLNGSPLWAGRRRAGGFGPDWWAAHLSRPALGCQAQQPGGYRGRGVCQRAAAPEGPEDRQAH